MYPYQSLTTRWRVIDEIENIKNVHPDRNLETVLTDGEYFVEVFQVEARWGKSIRLAVQRGDKESVRSWRILQDIKNDLAGRDSVAIEIYPREIEVSDIANIYHLWVLPDGVELPIGLFPGPNSSAR
jgi:hypothetical protein